MQIGMIGLGRMGDNMAQRLMKAGHECVVYDVRPRAVRELGEKGAIGTDSLKDFAARLSTPRTIWCMVPAATVDKVLASLVPLLTPGDIVIDGGNSYYRDDIRRGSELKKQGIHYMDVGTSGGVAGLERGYCLMIGGDEESVRHTTPIFTALAPGEDAAPRTPGRTKTGGTSEQGFLHCGPHGAGHFVKMVHNGIEYGIMAAYAEGFDVLRNANAGAKKRREDAETSPLQHPEFYRYDIDLPEVAELWRRGSVISSWLLDLTAAALLGDPQLKDFSGRVSDSGEARWTVEAGVEEGVPVPVISAALFGRFASRGGADYADRLLSAMRKQFGGHIEMKG